MSYRQIEEASYENEQALSDSVIDEQQNESRLNETYSDEEHNNFNDFDSEGSDPEYHGCSSHYMIDSEEVDQHEKQG